MTLSEFLIFRNSENKFHPNDSYQNSLDDLNRTYGTTTKIQDNFVAIEYDNGIVFYKDESPVGVLHSNVLYASYWFHEKYFDYSSDKITWTPSKIIKTKYLDDQIEMVLQRSKKNRKNHPAIINRISVKNEKFEIRTSKLPYEENSGETIVILEETGLLVAFISDEWGATLVTVAKEYRGYRFGPLLTKLWYEHNPDYKSGGFTSSGQNNAITTWANRVREYLANGWYSDAVRQGLLTTEKVNKIIETLPIRKSKPVAEDRKDKPLIFSDGIQIIIYDRQFLVDQDEKYIYAFGFIRDFPNGDLYPFKVNYEKKYKKIFNYAFLQMCRDEDIELFIGGKADFVDFDSIPGVSIDHDYVIISKNLMNLKDFVNHEAHLRQKTDPYNEIFYSLIEMANGKWS